MNTPESYERLTRSRFGLKGTGSLWMAKDYLLQVSNTFAVERYRRWYFRDIQAFIVRRTATRLIWNLVIGVFAFLFLIIAGGTIYGGTTAAGVNEPVAFMVIGTVTGFFGLVFLAVALINTAMGPTCAVFVKTPHGLDRISSPNRIAAFQKISERLQPLLITTQTSPAGDKDMLQDIAAALDQPLS